MSDRRRSVLFTGARLLDLRRQSVACRGVRPEGEDGRRGGRVQIVDKRHGVQQIVEYVGSAHDEIPFAALLATARERIRAGQQALGLSISPPPAGQAVVAGSASEMLCNVLLEAYRRLGFDVIADEAFRTLVLAGSC